MSSSQTDTRFSKKRVKTTYRKGAFPLINPSLHDHRERRKSLERDPLGGIYIKTYQTSKMRASNAEIDFNKGYLKNELFDPIQPHKSIPHWIRVRDLKKEGPTLRYGLRTENEDITNSIKDNLSLIDHASRKMQMVHSPCWKELTKAKWIDPKKGFIASSRSSQAISDSKWPVISIKSEDPYIGGFKEIEATLARHRDKSKEQPHGFIGQIRNDPWETTLNLSNSVRSYKAEMAMHGNQDQLMFSVNHKLDQTTYKSSLIETGSVDHIVPFNHSNNYQAKPLKNVGQNYPKTYRSSLVQYGIAEIGNEDLASYHRNQSTTKASETECNHNDSTSPSRRTDTLQTHQMSVQSHAKKSHMSYEKSRKHPIAQSFSEQNFKYDPPTDQQVQEAVSKYFKRK